MPGLLALWGLALACALIALWHAHAYDWVPWWAGGWLLAFTAGAVLTVRGALRRHAGVAWSRGSLLIAIIAAGVLSVTTLWNMDLAARSRLAAVRAESQALAASLAPSRPPDSRNAALVYEQAFGLIGEDAEVPQFSPEGDNATARAFVRDHAGALRLLRQAATMPDAYFRYPLGEAGMDAVTSVLRQMRQGATLLLLEARLQAADGKAGPALEDVEATFGLARHVGDNPILIQALVVASLCHMANAALQDVLRTCHPSLADLKEAPVDQTFSCWRVLHRSMEGEGHSAWPPSRTRPMRRATASSWRNELRGYRSLMQAYDTIDRRALLPGQGGHRPAGQGGAQRPGRHVRRHACRRHSAGLPPPPPAPRRPYELDNMALAATAYRIEHGAFPKEAADLVPDYMTLMPLDPFTGEPMKVRAEDGGAVLYSVGPDMADDDGAPFDQTSRKGDITFRLGGR